MAIADCKSLYDSMLKPTVPNISDREAALDAMVCCQVLGRTGTTVRWVFGPMNLADIYTKDKGTACDLWRVTVRSGKHTAADEDETLMRHAEERERQKDLAPRRQNDAGKPHKKQKTAD